MLDFSQAATSLAIPSGQVRTTSSCSQTHSRTGGDREGHGETKQRFYQGFRTHELRVPSARSRLKAALIKVK